MITIITKKDYEKTKDIYRGMNLKYKIKISIDEKYIIKKKIIIPMHIKCNVCYASGIKINKILLCSCEKTKIQTSLDKICAVCCNNNKTTLNKCNKCLGTGTNRNNELIQISLENNKKDKIYIHQKGEYSIYGGLPGKLYILLYYKIHPIIKKK